jgi:hypothetical protein
METPTFMYAVLPSEKREELIIKRNVRVIKEFLRKREQLQNATEEEITRLEHLCKKKTVDASTYRSLRQAIAVKYYLKRLKLIRATLKKSVRIEPEDKKKSYRS